MPRVEPQLKRKRSMPVSALKQLHQIAEQIEADEGCDIVTAMGRAYRRFPKLAVLADREAFGGEQAAVESNRGTA